MKRVLKIAGIVIGVIVLLLVCVAIFIHFKGIPTYEVNAPDINIEADSLMLAQGERLTSMVCAGCHYDKDHKLSGKHMFDIPSSFGTVYSPNITRHPNSTIAAYTDGELVYLLRTGIKRDGSYAPPWMAKLPLMSDYDMHSIIAFLRSDHPITDPVDIVQPACKPSLLVKFLSHFAFVALPMPEGPIEAPSPNDQVAYGRYISDATLQCFSCHSADFKELKDLKPEESGGYYGGGTELTDSEGNPVFSANITMHETGMAGWTRDQFADAVRIGKKPDGTLLSDAMPPHPLVSDMEIDAIWAYLQTVPNIDNDVPRGPQ